MQTLSTFDNFLIGILNIPYIDKLSLTFIKHFNIVHLKCLVVSMKV